jgi:hypothetical protein
VWGTASGTDNIVWGTADGVDNIVWGTSTTSTTWTTSGGTSYSWSWLLSLTDEQVFAILNPPPISILNLKTVQLGSLYGGTF